MGIDLRRDEMRVAEQFLHAPQIRTRVQQVRRVTVPQFVRGQAGIESGNGEILFQTPGQLNRLEPCVLFWSAKNTGDSPDGGRFNVLQ